MEALVADRSADHGHKAEFVEREGLDGRGGTQVQVVQEIGVGGLEGAGSLMRIYRDTRFSKHAPQLAGGDILSLNPL